MSIIYLNNLVKKEGKPNLTTKKPSLEQPFTYVD